MSDASQPTFGITAQMRRLAGSLTAPAPARSAVLIRSALVVIILMRLVFRDWWLLSTTPPALFDPVFGVSWLHGPPSNVFVTILWLVGIAGAILCLFRIRSQVTFIVAWVCLVELCAMWSSSGKVMHNDILLIWACVPFLFASAPRRGDVSVDSRWGWAPRASMITITTIYFATGVQKFRHSGLEWVFSDNLSWVIRQGKGIVPSTISHDIASFTPLTVTAAAVTLIFELGAPLLVAWPRTRALWAITVAAFHLANFILLGLDYYGWILTVIVVVVFQSPIPDRIARLFGRLIGTHRLPEAWQTRP